MKILLLSIALVFAGCATHQDQFSAKTIYNGYLTSKEVSKITANLQDRGVISAEQAQQVKDTQLSVVLPNLDKAKDAYARYLFTKEATGADDPELKRDAQFYFDFADDYVNGLQCQYNFEGCEQ